MLHMPVVLSAIFAVAIGALAGWVQNQLVWAPLRHKRVGVMQQMIVTIGLSMALQYIYQFFFGGDIKGIVKSVPEGIQLGPIVTNAPTLIAAAIALVTIVSVTVFLYCTRLGRATRAVSDNAALAAASGINVDSVVRIVWILSCGLAALSGVLIGIHLNGIAGTPASRCLCSCSPPSRSVASAPRTALWWAPDRGHCGRYEHARHSQRHALRQRAGNSDSRSADSPAGHFRQAKRGWADLWIS